jgi:hypothetical protein
MNRTISYFTPIQSRDKRLWLCFVPDDHAWTLSTTPDFQYCEDLGYRWADRALGISVLNLVSRYMFGSKEMKSTLARWGAHFFNCRTRQEQPKGVIELLYEDYRPVLDP